MDYSIISDTQEKQLWSCSRCGRNE